MTVPMLRGKLALQERGVPSYVENFPEGAIPKSHMQADQKWPQNSEVTQPAR